MHGFIMAPLDAEAPPAPRPRLRVGLRGARAWFGGVVVAPLLVAAVYLYGFAADQYLSEAHFLVRAQGGGRPSPGGIAALLKGGEGAASAAAPDAALEANSVADYLTSHDVVETLSDRIGLAQRFNRPEADALLGLGTDQPTPEALLRYYRRQVDVHYDPDTGITSLRARAFRPGDAYAIARALLWLGELRVNAMNARAYGDGLAQSRREVAEAQGALTRVQARVAALRRVAGDADPSRTASAQIGLVSTLTGDLAAARAQLGAARAALGPRSPQVQALAGQVRSLSAQVAAQDARLAGGAGGIAADLGSYEVLRLEQDFLAKRYDAAAAAFEQARERAQRQQLYLVRVVDPNYPVESRYPRRELTLLTLAAVLLVAYGLGWLIAAGVREHAG